MLHETIESALNRQVNAELAAAHQYLAMAAYFYESDLSGFASWMRAQSAEEHAHANRLINYLIDRGGHTELDAIKRPQVNFGSPLEVFEKALETERENTRSINEIYGLATSHSDFTTQSHLTWFLDEQVEEEKSLGEIVSLVTLTSDDASALLHLNSQLGSRQPGASDKKA